MKASRMPNYSVIAITASARLRHKHVCHFDRAMRRGWLK
jgi:hypothetical protein